MAGGDADGPRIRIAVCQINPTVGDLDNNLTLALDALATAEQAGADVAVLPELALTGYPPEDLVLRPGFVAASRATLERFAAATGECVAVIGCVDGSGEPSRRIPDMAGPDGSSGAYNAVAVCSQGRIRGIYHKRHLPNYDVFDELRHFRVGRAEPPLFEIAGAVAGVTVCEDAWVADGPMSDLARAGAQLVLNVNGSPFRAGKQQVREETIGRLAAEAGVAVAYVNLVGGQDELVFDGGSFVVDAGGAVVARCVSFADTVDVFDVELGAEPSSDLSQPARRAEIITAAGRSARGPQGEPMEAPLVTPMDLNAQRWQALVLATRDYVHKSGFADVCVGLSGGVDSSLTAVVAVDALGADHVHGVLMPSRYSSEHSVADAEKLAANLGIDARIIAIEPAHEAFGGMLGGDLEPGGLTDQNIQARVRGVTLMALANETGALVLTTGNKSELAVGYSTLYGDTAGAFAPLCDLWKLDVYELGRWRNQQAAAELIPATVLTKAPSAELAPGQRDDQSLPPYEVLDSILRLYVEELRGVDEIVDAQVAPAHDVQRVCAMVDAAEYKRRQSPLGPRLTGRAFGRDRRMPIINRYRSTANR